MLSSLRDDEPLLPCLLGFQIFLMKANAMIELYFKLIILSTFVLDNSTFLLLSDCICLCYCFSVAD